MESIKLFFFIAAAGLAGCSYIETMVSQADYSWRQKTSPEQRIYKHMLNHESFFVSGKIGNTNHVNREAIAVIAVSDKFRSSEVVDVNHAVRPNSYYNLNLPAGDYQLLVVSDFDRNGYYDETEVIGTRMLSLTKSHEGMVLNEYDIALNERINLTRSPFQVNTPRTRAGMESLFYPNGAIRSLDDPIFSPEVAALGMYEPGAFLEKAPAMFYALEEDFFYKVPVIFVHGIGGSIRVFDDMLAALDRTRYKPWFFYYPSGADLNQLSTMFYAIFLSGKVLSLEEMPMVIVAHSMGGLVAREALNLRAGTEEENRVQKLITIASPMGGIPSARRGEKAPVVIPVWRDINPDSEFIKGLHRKPLPAGMEYHLSFAYGDPRKIKLGDNSDGVVPLANQLSLQAQKEATAQLGFNDTHMGILKNHEVIQNLLRIVEDVRAPLPEPHMRELLKGGYPVDLGSNYTPLEKFYIQHMGFFMDALASGELAPIHSAQKHFARTLGEKKFPYEGMATGWMKFVSEYPDRRSFVQYAADGTNLR